MPEYRIVRDAFLGYEVQHRRWWWPFWVQGRTNTHRTIEDAKRYAERRAKGLNEGVVEYLGELGDKK